VGVGVGVPSVTVTFLFSDVEGSTRLWEVHREAMRSAFAGIVSRLPAQRGAGEPDPAAPGDELALAGRRWTRPEPTTDHLVRSDVHPT
jgi:hypothetical protein